MNPNLINPDSKLGFEVHTIRNIYHSDGSPLRAFFSSDCEGKNFEIGGNENNDTYEVNKILEFPITKGNEYLYVRAQDVGGGYDADPESELIVVVDLKELRDQKLHTNTYRCNVFSYSCIREISNIKDECMIYL